MRRLDCLYFIRSTLSGALPSSWWGGNTVLPPAERPSRAKVAMTGVKFENHNGDSVWVHVFGRMVIRYQGRVWSHYDRYPIWRRPMGKARVRHLADLAVLFLTLDRYDQERFLDVLERLPAPGPVVCEECGLENPHHEKRCLAGLDPLEALVILHEEYIDDDYKDPPPVGPLSRARK